jgi:hypothetical protein
MPKRGAAEGGLVVGNNKLKDWKGPLPLRVHKMLAAFNEHYNKKNNLTGDERVTEGDVIASIASDAFMRDSEFMKKFEAGEFDGAAGEPAGSKGGK